MPEHADGGTDVREFFTQEIVFLGFAGRAGSLSKGGSRNRASRRSRSGDTSHLWRAQAFRSQVKIILDRIGTAASLIDMAQRERAILWHCVSSIRGWLLNH